MTRVKLGTILKEQKTTVKKADGNGLNLIGVSNEIGLHISKAKKIDDLSRYKLIEKGWFAYNPMRVNVGSIGFAFEEEHIGIVSPDYVIFSCSSNILQEYLFHLLRSDEGIEAINKNASGAVRKRLYFSDLAKIEIVLPSIEIQQQRLHSFDKIKNLGKQISEYKTKESFLAQFKQNFLQEAIQGKFTEKWRSQNPNIESAYKLLERSKEEKKKLIKEKKIKKENELPSIPKEEIPFDIPKKWVWCRINDLGQTYNGDSINKEIKLVKYSLIQNGLNYIGTKDVEFEMQGINYETGIIIPTSEINNPFKIAPKGSVMTCIEGGSSGKKIALTERDICFGNKLLATVPFISSLSKYLFFLYNSSHFKNAFENQSKGLRGGVSINSFKSIVIPLPPLEELNIIVEKIESLMVKFTTLEQEITQSAHYANMLMQAVLKEAFEVKTKSINLDSLFEDTNYNLYVAIIHMQIENRLKINYGEVATQKTVFNINAFTDQKIPYNFINSNHGTFSPQLKEDLSKNSYLIKDRKGNGEVFITNPPKQKEVLNALSNPKNKSFVRAVNEVLDIYELPFINKETDKIELLNTVTKLIIDNKSIDLEIIYSGMQKWEIKQNGYKTKAEKFSKADTKKMIGLIEGLGLVNRLLKNDFDTRKKQSNLF